MVEEEDEKSMEVEVAVDGKNLGVEVKAEAEHLVQELVLLV